MVIHLYGGARADLCAGVTLSPEWHASQPLNSTQAIDAKLNQLLVRPLSIESPTPTNIYYRPKISYQDSMNRVSVRKNHINSNNDHSNNDHSIRSRHSGSSTSYQTHNYGQMEGSSGEQVTSESLGQEYPRETVIIVVP